MDANNQHLTDADIVFIMWMNSLDPVQVAKTNSFYSREHYEMLRSRQHKEEDKSPVRKRVQVKNVPKRVQPATVKSGKKRKTDYVFTERQLEIAVKSLERMNNV